MISQVALFSLVASMAAAQTLNIPTRAGEIITLPEPSTITGDVDFGNKEFDRGQPCDSDEDTGSDNAVFLLEDGASISNVIIGADSLEGVHCLGSCTLTNVWFRDVCEDAVSVLGTGDAMIIGGGAQEAKDKVIQHNGAGTVTIEDYTIVNAGKLYRSCGDCTDNSKKSPRNVIVKNVRAFGVTSDLIGINSNFGDTASITGSCGTTKSVCREYKGVDKGNGKSEKLDTNESCTGDQGKLETLPECGAEEVPPPEETATSEVATPTAPAPTSEVAPTEAVPTEAAPTSEAATASEVAITSQASTLITKTSAAKPTATATDEDTSSGSVKLYGQCGGNNYKGATKCAEGKCVKSNEWYSQCI